MIPPTPDDVKRIIGCAPGTRLQRIIRTPNGWQLWIATRDFIYGSYLELHEDGSAYRWNINEEGDECILIRRSDDELT